MKSRAQNTQVPASNHIPSCYGTLTTPISGGCLESAKNNEKRRFVILLSIPAGPHKSPVMFRGQITSLSALRRRKSLPYGNHTVTVRLPYRLVEVVSKPPKNSQKTGFPILLSIPAVPHKSPVMLRDQIQPLSALTRRKSLPYGNHTVTVRVLYRYSTGTVRVQLNFGSKVGQNVS